MNWSCWKAKMFFLCDDRSNCISFFGDDCSNQTFFGGCSNHIFFYDDCSNRVFVWRWSSALLQFFAIIVHMAFFLAMIVQIAFFGDAGSNLFFFCEERSKRSFRHYFWQSSATSISQRISASRNLHVRTSVFKCKIAKKKTIFFLKSFFLRFFFP